MNVIDIILAIPLLWFAYKGWTNGMIMEIVKIIALLGGLFVAMRFSEVVEQKLPDSQHGGLLAFLLTFIAIAIGIYFLGKALDGMANAMMLGFFNKIMGTLISMFKIALIISFLIYFFNYLDPKEKILEKELRDESLLFRPIEKIAPSIMPNIKNFIS